MKNIVIIVIALGFFGCKTGTKPVGSSIKDDESFDSVKGEASIIVKDDISRISIRDDAARAIFEAMTSVKTTSEGEDAIEYDVRQGIFIKCYLGKGEVSDEAFCSVNIDIKGNAIGTNTPISEPSISELGNSVKGKSRVWKSQSGIIVSFDDETARKVFEAMKQVPVQQEGEDAIEYDVRSGIGMLCRIGKAEVEDEAFCSFTVSDSGKVLGAK